RSPRCAAIPRARIRRARTRPPRTARTGSRPPSRSCPHHTPIVTETFASGGELRQVRGRNGRQVFADRGSLPPGARLLPLFPGRVLVPEVARADEARTAPRKWIAPQEGKRGRIRVEQLLHQTDEPELVAERDH